MKTHLQRSWAASALAIVLLLPMAAHAAGPRFRLEVSGLDGMLTRRADDLLDDPAMRISWAAGGTVAWSLAPRWSLETGLRYLRLHEDEDFSFPAVVNGSPGVFRGDEKTDWHWIAMPVRAAFRLRGPLVLEAGTELRYLVSAYVHASDGGSAIVGSGIVPGLMPARDNTIFEEAGTYGDRDVTSSYSRVDVALTAGAGLERPLGRHVVSVHARYAHGLPDLAKGTLERRTRAAELALGWTW